MKPHHDESGVALIAALSLLVTIGLLVMATVALSQLASFGIGTNIELARSGYVAEGALNRVIYLIAAEQSLHGVTDPLDLDYAALDEDEERYLADGVERTLDYYGIPVRYRIFNGAGNLNLNQLSAIVAQRMVEDEELAERLSALQTKIADYIDGDDEAGSDDGLEVDDYTGLKREPLPRNAPLQFREELWWIPDAAAFLPPDADGRMTGLNPPTLGTNTTPDLFQADYTLLTDYAGLEREDAINVLNALAEWQVSRTALADNLEATLLATLKQKFSTANRTGFYRVKIDRAAPEGRPALRLEGIFSDAGVAGPSSGVLAFYEWMRY